MYDMPSCMFKQFNLKDLCVGKQARQRVTVLVDYYSKPEEISVTPSSKNLL